LISALTGFDCETIGALIGALIAKLNGFNDVVVGFINGLMVIGLPAGRKKGIDVGLINGNDVFGIDTTDLSTESITGKGGRLPTRLAAEPAAEPAVGGKIFEAKLSGGLSLGAFIATELFGNDIFYFYSML
jgi:hypothetical protein